MKRRKRGFTLIELLAVIVILVIIFLIAVAGVFIVINTSKKDYAKDSAMIYLKSIENYMTMHKVNPEKYPFEFEPGKTYEIDEIKNIINDDIEKPIYGDITLVKGDNIDNANLKIGGYDVICKSSKECEIGTSPVVDVIVPDGCSTSKRVEVLVVKKGIGLDDKPVSYDGGKTWTSDLERIIKENSELSIAIKDKIGRKVDSVYICTKKSNGKGENCVKNGEIDKTTGKAVSLDKITVACVDNTAPSCEIEVIGTKTETGYYTSDVEVKIKNAKDLMKGSNGEFIDGSGIKTGIINYTKITKDGTYEVVGTVVDRAGNQGTCKETVIKDTTGPKVELEVVGTKVFAGYESGAVVKTKCTDDLSGVSEKSNDKTLTTKGENTVEGTCKDNAGNVSKKTGTYTIYTYSQDASCGCSTYKSCSSCGCAENKSCSSTTCARYKTCNTSCDEVCVGGYTTTTVPKEECTNETYQDCKDETYQDCKDETYQDCKDVSKETCKDVPKETCKDVPKETCKNVSKETCKTVPKTTCKSVPKKSCKKVCAGYVGNRSMCNSLGGSYSGGSNGGRCKVCENECSTTYEQKCTTSNEQKCTKKPKRSVQQKPKRSVQQKPKRNVQQKQKNNVKTRQDKNVQQKQDKNVQIKQDRSVQQKIKL